MATWNPSPPELQEDIPEDLLRNDDRIGDTVLSKVWVLSVIVKLISLVEDDDKTKPHNKDSPSGLEEQTPSEVGSETVETVTDPSQEIAQAVRGGQCCTNPAAIDEGLEAAMCKLWDVSSNTDVVMFLHGHCGAQLLTGVIARLPCPRVMEICVGILSNMACVGEVCLASLCDEAIILLLLSFMSYPDIGVLVELVRLVVTCLSHDEAQQCWLEAMSSSTTVLEDITFILQSSTSKELLRSISSMLNRILDLDNVALIKWANRKLIIAICEAIKETCSLPSDSFDVSCSLMLSLQLFSTIEEGVCLLNEDDLVSIHLANFLLVSLDNEDWNEDTSRGLVASLSLCLCLLEQDGRQRMMPLLSEGALLNYFERLTTISDSSDAPGTSDWSGVSDELKDSIANSACCILKCLQQT